MLLYSSLILTFLLRNVEEIVKFCTLSSAKQLSYASRQLVAREIELEKVRRSENYFKMQEQVSRYFSIIFCRLRRDATLALFLYGEIIFNVTLNILFIRSNLNIKIT